MWWFAVVKPGITDSWSTHKVAQLEAISNDSWQRKLMFPSHHLFGTNKYVMIFFILLVVPTWIKRNRDVTINPLLIMFNLLRKNYVKWMKCKTSNEVFWNVNNAKFRPEKLPLTYEGSDTLFLLMHSWQETKSSKIKLRRTVGLRIREKGGVFR